MIDPLHHRDMSDAPLVSTQQTYRVLSLSGGGYRGLFTAQLLARIEREFLNDEPIGNHVDMIAGSSAGGLIAVALACGVSAQRAVTQDA
jgi:patatin-like phospholipase/acyl hydrolase